MCTGTEISAAKMHSPRAAIGCETRKASVGDPKIPSTDTANTDHHSIKKSKSYLPKDHRCDIGNGDSEEEEEIDSDERNSLHSSREMLSVSFSTIEIKEYPVIAGDNPSVSTGAPVTISWVPLESTAKFTVQDYEDNKPLPRSVVELRMPSAHRETVLKRQGFSRNEILKAAKAATITRNQRKRTSETMKLAPAQEACEKVARAVWNATLKRAEKNRERKLLDVFRRSDRCSSADRLDKGSSNTMSCSSFTSSSTLEPSTNSEAMNDAIRIHKGDIAVTA